MHFCNCILVLNLYHIAKIELIEVMLVECVTGTARTTNIITARYTATGTSIVTVPVDPLLLTRSRAHQTPPPSYKINHHTKIQQRHSRDGSS